MISLTGEDVTFISARILEFLADGDCVTLDIPNDIAAGKRGKNGNVLIAYNSTGEQVDVTLRVLKGSPDDKFLNSELIKYKNQKASYILLTGEFIKNIGDGLGNITREIYTMTAGFVKKLPTTKENQEGDTEQAVSIYTLQFNNVDRGLA